MPYQLSPTKGQSISVVCDVAKLNLPGYSSGTLIFKIHLNIQTESLLAAVKGYKDSDKKEKEEEIEMKKVIILTCALLIMSLCLMACSKTTEHPKEITYEATYEDFMEGESIKWIANAGIGDTIVVTLGSNPTTGFEWSGAAQISNLEILKQVDHKFAPAEQTGALGTSGKDVWTFKTLKVGTTEISMDYSRPWEGGEKEEWTFVATITVE
jgi:inhibitor of cysteine peptidase